MKPILLLLGIALSVSYSFAQVRGEFATQENGLMYSDKDIKTLRFIVDSLNLRFKRCEFNKEIYSLPQGWADYISFVSTDEPLTSIVEDIKAGVGYVDLVAKYKKYVKGNPTRRLLVSYGEDERKYVVFSEGTPENGYESKHFDKVQFFPDMKGRWFYDYAPKDKYSKQYSVRCWYLEKGLVKTKIPIRYSKLLEYVDCMVDTNAISKLAKEWKEEKPKGELNSLTALRKYIQARGNLKATKINNEVDFYYASLMTADEYKFAESHLAKDNEFLRLLNLAADDCIRYRFGDESMEDLVGNTVSKKKALLMKKSRIVMGQCSQDQSPRLHALDVALLAAESHSWDIFLRSHLDIMNDRFSRISDGSYAYGDRKTYLKELEELNLNIVDLMLGLAMRADNLPEYHYFGTVWRVAWALTESREQDRFKQMVMEMMKDPELDEFNRGLAFMVYTIYLRRHDDKVKALQLTNEFRSMASEFPESLRPYIASIKDPSKEEELRKLRVP